MNRISKVLIAAAIVASTAGAANAQGNVQPSHYNEAGKLVLDNAQQNPVAHIDRSNDGLSSFAAAPVENESAITVPGGSIGYNELLATH